jgi:peptidoglycan hydrolase CwlO-like protein
MMNRAGKLLTILAVAALGLWGCAKGPANPGDQAGELHKLEKKCATLEKDYRALAAARDEATKKAAALEEESKELKKQLGAQKAQVQKEQEAQQLLAKERDDLRRQTEARTNERDALQVRCDRLKKGLQNLIGQDEAYLAAPPQTPPSAQVLGN